MGKCRAGLCRFGQRFSFAEYAVGGTVVDSLLGHFSLKYCKWSAIPWDGYPATDGDVAEHVDTDVQAIAIALIALINSLPSGGERVQLYRAVQDV